MLEGRYHAKRSDFRNFDMLDDMQQDASNQAARGENENAKFTSSFLKGIFRNKGSGK